MNFSAMTLFARNLLPAMALLWAGCASVDLDAPKEATYQITDTSNSRLGRVVEEIREGQGETSGFHLQRDGIQSLAARLVLAAEAEHSIDTQYYLITNDEVGRLFVAALLDAADRGVRVRLLLDDILAGGYDSTIAALNSHPNFEVRIFNPFTSRGLRVRDGLFDLARVNRRMHNKSFTVDNQVTIVGGRNIATEYFGANRKQNYGDADVMAVGPVVPEVSTMFDEYWNSRWAAPMEVFAKVKSDPTAELGKIREVFRANWKQMERTVYGEALRADARDILDNRRGYFEWAEHELVYDPIAKTEGQGFKAQDGIAGQLAEVVAEAEHELMVVSPYFVPLKSGVEYFQSLIDRGLRVRVLTNSLAANNHGIVHSGYMPYRKELLRMGVELYETRVNAEVTGVDRGGSGAALATLHTKAFLVDRDILFLGSFNWDPRSAVYNTESGVVIESDEIGGKVHRMIDRGLRQSSYRLDLDENDNIQWIDESGDSPVVKTSEPDVSWWRLFTVNLGRMLPIRGQL
jgi:cardiolipin synthase C